jgi:hypothetical protein
MAVRNAGAARRLAQPSAAKACWMASSLRRARASVPPVPGGGGGGG